MQSPESLLKKYFGYDNFRKGQREVVQALLEKKDILAIMPTGAGKSICFQIPSLLMPYGVVVISPLISLSFAQTAPCAAGLSLYRTAMGRKMFPPSPMAAK